MEQGELASSCKLIILPSAEVLEVDQTRARLHEGLGVGKVGGGRGR